MNEKQVGHFNYDPFIQNSKQLSAAVNDSKKSNKICEMRQFEQLSQRFDGFCLGENNFFFLNLSAVVSTIFSTILHYICVLILIHLLISALPWILIHFSVG